MCGIRLNPHVKDTRPVPVGGQACKDIDHGGPERFRPRGGRIVQDPLVEDFGRQTPHTSCHEP